MEKELIVKSKFFQQEDVVVVDGDEVASVINELIEEGKIESGETTLYSHALTITDVNETEYSAKLISNTQETIDTKNKLLVLHTGGNIVSFKVINGSDIDIFAYGTLQFELIMRMFRKTTTLIPTYTELLFDNISSISDTVTKL